MRIQKLRLTAFGPFTGKELDLSSGKEGLHVIYGPNEAGKSSALRALVNLLYGIPVRSDDNFLHDYKRMRIGAILKSDSGDCLDFVRTKGMKNTLCRVDDESKVLDDSVLIPFLKGIGQDQFKTMFGIGYEDLIEGGKELVLGKGSLGQAMFSAGAGVKNLREIAAALQKEADDLFRPSGPTKIINVALGELKKCQKEQKECSLSPTEWQKLVGEKEKADKDEKEASENLKIKEGAHRRLERIRDAVPLISKRKGIREEAKNFNDATVLPDDFGERRTGAQNALAISENDEKTSADEIRKLEEQIGKIMVQEVILNNEEVIKHYYKQHGVVLKAAVDRHKIEMEMNGLLGESRGILSGIRDDITLEESESLRPKRASIDQVNRLARDHSILVSKIETLNEQIKDDQEEISNLKRKIDTAARPLVTGTLGQVVEAARKISSLEEQYLENAKDIKTDQKSLENMISRQPLWLGSLDDLEKLSILDSESINLFENEFDTKHKKKEQLEIERGRIDEALKNAKNLIETIETEADVPTEEYLLSARAKREGGWRLILKDWRGPGAGQDAADYIKVFPPSESLENAYEMAVETADEVADRRCREAARVNQHATLKAEIKLCKEQLAELDLKISSVSDVIENLKDKWNALWRPAGVQPLTPREMRAWARDMKASAENAKTIRERREKNENLNTKVLSKRNAIEIALIDLSEPAARPDETLVELIDRAAEVIKREEKASKTISVMEEDKRKKEIDINDAVQKTETHESNLESWRREWSDTVASFGFDKNVEPDTAISMIADLKDLFEKKDKAETCRGRIEGIDEEERVFTENIKNLCESIAPELSGRSPINAITELNARLNKNITEKEKKDGLSEQLKWREEKLQDAKEKVEASEKNLLLLCNEAGCTAGEGLKEAEEQSKKRLEIEKDLKNVDDRLIALCGGMLIDDFLDEVEKEDPDTIDSTLNQIEMEIDELRQKRDLLLKTKALKENEMMLRDGSTRAVELAEDTQLIMGRIESGVERWARLRMAVEVLNTAIERYREKNQGPILTRASELFSKMTLGSFEKIQAQFGSNGDEPVMVGVRSKGSSKETVEVDGMSDGTTDQLYLALRLASFEEWIQKNGPMPFILDDILIKFDNERAVATLKVLADLSERAQVIFFSHHQHLVDMAGKEIGPGVLYTHAL